MPDPKPDAWIEDEPQDLPPPEPAPAGWAAPTPLEPAPTTAQIEVTENAQVGIPAYNKSRRFWITTLLYLGLWGAAVIFIHAGESYLFPLFVLVPLYLLTLPLVLRKPKAKRKGKGALLDRVDWQSRLMASIVVFLCIYIPFVFISGPVVPFASLVEYLLFALLLFLLLRLGGRGAGVAPSLDALPPPNHRLHQQIVAPIDDAHYQRTLWLNYSFVEKGRGARHLARRVDEILESNGIAPDRRSQLLTELHQYEDGGFFGRRRERQTQRDRRIQVLERLFLDLNHELEKGRA